jgi:hypothetical protein
MSELHVIFGTGPLGKWTAAWKKFNQAVSPDGTVGIWQETFLVNPDQYERVYGNMPAFGLGAAVEHTQAVGRRQTARLRLSANL